MISSITVLERKESNKWCSMKASPDSSRKRGDIKMVKEGLAVFVVIMVLEYCLPRT